MTQDIQRGSSRRSFHQFAKEPEVACHALKDDGVIPNNERLPLMIYRHVLSPAASDSAVIFEEAFAKNQWPGSWRNGIFGFHHYHSTAHEVLGIYSGTAKVQLGGVGGETLTIELGDVVIIPAGVAHKKLSSSRDFGVVGAYPAGQSPDICYAKESERPASIENIARVPLPPMDPIYGSEGPLLRYWRDETCPT